MGGGLWRRRAIQAKVFISWDTLRKRQNGASRVGDEGGGGLFPGGGNSWSSRAKVDGKVKAQKIKERYIKEGASWGRNGKRRPSLEEAFYNWSQKRLEEGAFPREKNLLSGDTSGRNDQRDEVIAGKKEGWGR